MTLFEFNGSDKPTIGVEIELQILDQDTLDLAPHSDKLLQLCHQQGIERIKTEIHQSMVEVDSEISLNVKECYEFLKKRITDLDEIAESLGLRLGVTATHPFQHWADRLITNQDRYQNLHEKYQWLARRMNVYGLHVHVGIRSGERALAVSHTLNRYLPHLLALSANSPFWQGLDTGMQSSRINIMDAFPFAGLPQNFLRWQDFEHYYLTLKRVGAIQSLKDLYWHIRPNLEFGTLEIRICDAMSSLSETMAVVALIQCLTVWIDENLSENPLEKWTTEHFWIAPENQWIAARDGLEGVIITDLSGTRKKISDEILELIETLSPIAKRLNCHEELESINTIIKTGNGAQRQRKIYSETNSLEKVVELSLCEFQSNLSMSY